MVSNHRAAKLSPVVNRLGVLLTAVAVSLGSLTSSAVAQDVAARTETIRATDGFPLKVTYYPADPKANPKGIENAPVVILLHGEGGDRVVWDKRTVGQTGESFAEILQKRGGYAVITVDLRKHGESADPRGQDKTERLRPSDYEAMIVRDLEGIKEFIFDEHMKRQLNMGKIGIVAADMSTPLAVNFALFDWQKPDYDDASVASARTPRGRDVRTLVLLSPVQSVSGIQLNRALNFLRKLGRQLPVLIIVGSSDSKDRDAARSAYQKLAPGRDEEHVEFKELPTNLRGTELIGQGKIGTEAVILGFLDKHLKELDLPWRDRRSRLDR